MRGPPPNPNDAIRLQILRYFYNRNARAASRFGKRGSAVRISDVKRELKALHGLTQPEVISNLTYLIDREWVKTVDQTKSVATRGGTVVPSVVTFYEVSALGIEKIEGASEFQPRERYPGINIQATGQNVITLGDGNVVNVNYQHLFEALEELQHAIARSAILSDDVKLESVVDIETLKDQLAKAEPDRAVATQLWPRISRAADLAGLASLAVALVPLIQPLIR
jgi:hypothetical protein